MSLVNIVRNFHDLKRFEDILLIFSEEGFSILIDNIKLSKYLPFHKRISSKISKKNIDTPIHLRKAFERLGPTFIKFGQILSLRPDLIPYEYMVEFEKMQDKVPPFPYKEVEKIVQTELNAPISKIFKSFEKKPIASASLSQVHKAVLKNGKIVAVKVKRPNIDLLIKTDIRLMKNIAELLDSHVDYLKKYKLPKIVREFENWTLKELDFKIEASNAKIFYNNFKKSVDIVIPKIYDEFTTKNIITMEYLDGIPLHDIDKIKKKHKNIHKIIEKGYSAVIRQVFEHGFYHADPHPGNILVLKDGRCAFLDFGIVGKFDNTLRKNSINLLVGVLDSDIDSVVRTFTKFGMGKDFDENEFKRELMQTFDPIYNQELGDIEVSLILEHAINLASKYSINVPPDYVLFGKTIVTLEGLGLKYDPKFKFAQMTKPVLEKILLKEYSPKKVIRGFKKNAGLYTEFFKNFPDRADRLMDKLSKGALDIDIEDTDIKALSVEMEKSSGNLAMGFIVAALIVGSSLIMQIENQTKFYDVPFIPLIGFILAGLLGLWVVKRTIFVKITR